MINRTVATAPQKPPYGILSVAVASIALNVTIQRGISTSEPNHANKILASAASTSSSTPFGLGAHYQTLEQSPAQTSLTESEEVDIAVDYEAQILVNTALETIETEDSLEQFQQSAQEFINRYGDMGIAALNIRLLQPSPSPSIEPLARRFITALGTQRGQPLDDDVKRLLMLQLTSSRAGRRSAAASALGAFRDPIVLAAFEERAKIEKNRIVRATLAAHIRVFKANGLSAAKIV